jgi:two-component system nitrate/nitrite response regulator NarL
MAPRPRRSLKRSKGSPLTDGQAPTKAANPRPGGATAGDHGDGPPIALVLIDDNRLLREGIVAMVRSQPGFKVLAASADATEALKKVREAKPDIVLVDFGLEDSDSLSLTATVHADVPEARVIVMGLLPMQEDVAHYVRAGASGFIMKDANFEEFFETIRAVARGAQVLPSQLTNTLFSQIVRNAAMKNPARLVDAVRLTSRERQVIDLLGEGLSNKEIANRMHIAVHTVKSHVHNVLEKLALHSRLEVAAFSHASGGSNAFSK